MNTNPVTSPACRIYPRSTLSLAAGTRDNLVVSNAIMRKGILTLVCLTQVCRLQAQREQDPVTAILQLFEQHPIVLFGEVHGCVQEHALLKKLVTSQEFAARVNDVVIETGNSLYQDVLDRYIAGE